MAEFVALVRERPHDSSSELADDGVDRVVHPLIAELEGLREVAVASAGMVSALEAERDQFRGLLREAREWLDSDEDLTGPRYGAFLGRIDAALTWTREPGD
ncbi:MAG TPA: hypothetical protein VGL20_02850 [Candidatus Dormibacteraeota bacterium]|jgi:hypothetical protein